MKLDDAMDPWTNADGPARDCMKSERSHDEITRYLSGVLP